MIRISWPYTYVLPICMHISARRCLVAGIDTNWVVQEKTWLGANTHVHNAKFIQMMYIDTQWSIGAVMYTNQLKIRTRAFLWWNLSSKCLSILLTTVLCHSFLQLFLCECVCGPEVRYVNIANYVCVVRGVPSRDMLLKKLRDATKLLGIGSLIKIDQFSKDNLGRAIV